MDQTFEKAILQLREARASYERACLEVWRATEREHAAVVAYVRQLGWDEAQAAVWFCEHQPRLNRSPAAAVATGEGDEVVRHIAQALAGIVA